MHMPAQGGRSKGDHGLVIEDLEISYRIARSKSNFIALKGVTFHLADEEFLCMVGPSGCGKSSILNAIAGLIKPTAGRIYIDGAPVSGPGRDRSVVFQSPSLLPWRSVLNNVRYGLELWGVPKQESIERSRRMIELVGLRGFENFYPGELSGGMQQRVNLARALAADPKLLLLDEPFAALDAQNREMMQGELLRIWEHTSMKSLFITHQIDEAILLADKVVVLSSRPGSVREVVAIELDRPRNAALRYDQKFIQYAAYIRRLIESDSREEGEMAGAEKPPR